MGKLRIADGNSEKMTGISNLRQFFKVLIVASLLFANSGCTSDPCESAKTGYEVFLESSLNLHEGARNSYLSEVKNWSDLYSTELAECESNFADFRKKHPERRVPTSVWSSPDEQFDVFGYSTCPDYFPSRPVDNPSNYGPARSEFLNAKRVIINNQSCFSAVEVVRAQEELQKG
jgi:hypothetical protein